MYGTSGLRGTCCGDYKPHRDERFGLEKSHKTYRIDLLTYRSSLYTENFLASGVSIARISHGYTNGCDGEMARVLRRLYEAGRVCGSVARCGGCVSKDALFFFFFFFFFFFLKISDTTALRTVRSTLPLAIHPPLYLFSGRAPPHSKSRSTETDGSLSVLVSPLNLNRLSRSSRVACFALLLALLLLLLLLRFFSSLISILASIGRKHQAELPSAPSLLLRVFCLFVFGRGVLGIFNGTSISGDHRG